MSTVAFMSLSFGEMLVVGVVALLVFGGRLPEVMRNLGRAYAKLRQGMNEVTHPIRQELRQLDVRPPPPPPIQRTPETPPLPYPTPEPKVPDDGRGELKPPPETGGASDEPPPV